MSIACVKYPGLSIVLIASKSFLPRATSAVQASITSEWRVPWRSLIASRSALRSVHPDNARPTSTRPLWLMISASDCTILNRFIASPME